MSGTVLLAARSEYGYTDKSWLAMPHEPEAVSPEVQAEISLRARSMFAESRAGEMERRDNHRWLERLRKAEMTALDRGIDIFRSQAVIRREILSMEQRLERPHSAPIAGTL